MQCVYLDAIDATLYNIEHATSSCSKLKCAKDLGERQPEQYISELDRRGESIKTRRDHAADASWNPRPRDAAGGPDASEESKTILCILQRIYDCGLTTTGSTEGEK